MVFDKVAAWGRFYLSGMHLGTSTSLRTTFPVSMRMQLVSRCICPSSHCRHLLNMVRSDQVKLVSRTFEPLAFQCINMHMIGCRGFLTQLRATSALYTLSVTTHQSFIIYIGYQCPTGFNLSQPSSLCCCPCLPKEASKFQGEWFLKFKI